MSLCPGAEGGSGPRADGAGRGSSAEDGGGGRSHLLLGGRRDRGGREAQRADGQERLLLSPEGEAVPSGQLRPCRGAEVVTLTSLIMKVKTGKSPDRG